MKTYLVIFAVGIVLASWLTPLVARWARRLGAIDHPGRRKIHSKATPLLGGVAVYFAFWLAFFCGLVINPRFGDAFDPAVTGVFVGSLILLIVGIINDVKGLRASFKFLIHVLVAMIATWWGVRFALVPDVGGIVGGGLTDMHLGHATSLIATVAWIVGMTNAVNFIDGVDALATGISVIAAVTLFIVAVHLQQFFYASLYVALAGAVIGFGGYNKYPARIFLGDSGSTFLGYVLACISVLACHKSAALGLLLIPLVALGVPLSDMTYVFLRRFMAGRNILAEDKGHVHHRLLEMGYTPREAVWVLYALAVALSMGTFFLINARSEFAALIVVMVTLGALAVAGRLRLFDVTEERRAADLDEGENYDSRSARTTEDEDLSASERSSASSKRSP